ncbi:MAG: FAD binding domain-containing protein [Clostridiales Family XIII bacterium]|jgi:CO/xanthine dehydrogenase FAD-binding subunit|nr:FAD binding domain-containing protein [Clostridiales Family XIII bacterium]
MVGGYIPFGMQEALEILAGGGCVPYAGGTDLMVKESAADTRYVFLHRIRDLKCITVDAEYFICGACCTYTELLRSRHTPAILKEAISQIAAPAIRNTATIGGNVANASPKADAALILMVTDALVRLQSKRGVRIVPIKELYLGRGVADILPDELISEFWVPLSRARLPYFYEKVGARKALAISRVSFAGIADVSGGRVNHVATAFGAVEDVIVRREEIDGMLTGLSVAEAQALKGEYLAAYDAAIKPIRGRVSAEYRKAVCGNLLGAFFDSHIK